MVASVVPADGDDYSRIACAGATPDDPMTSPGSTIDAATTAQRERAACFDLTTGATSFNPDGMSAIHTRLAILPVPATPPSTRPEHRQFIIAAVSLSAVIIALTVVFMLSSSAFKPAPGTSGQENQADNPALDMPYGGAKPDRPGAPGGWEQLALLGLILAAVGGGTAAMIHSGRKARRRNAAAADEKQGNALGDDHAETQAEMSIATKAATQARSPSGQRESIGEQEPDGPLDHRTGSGDRQPPM